MNFYTQEYQKYLKYKKKYLMAKQKISENFGNIQKGGSKYNSIWIEENFFSKNNFDYIINQLKDVELKDDSRSYNRKTICLNNDKYKNIYNKIYNDNKFLAFINSIKDKDCYIKSKPSYPIEYRKYFNGSQGMPWHKDLSMFEPDCFEIVLTLSNNSDSKFEWIDVNNKKNSISPQPNTIVVVRPNSVLHRVTPVNQGERTILKLIVEFIKNGMNDNFKKPVLYVEFNKCPF